METTGCDNDSPILYLIDDSVLTIDAARPEIGKFVLKLLGLANAAERTARYVFDEFIDLT